MRNMFVSVAERVGRDQLQFRMRAGEVGARSRPLSVITRFIIITVVKEKLSFVLIN